MPVDLTAPEGVRSALRRGLRLHEAGRSGDGLKPETVAWARRLADGDAASEQKIREMSAWHKRHAASKSPGWDEPGKEKPGFVAYLLWGGEPGEKWADRKVAELDRAERSAAPTAFTRATVRKVNTETLAKGEPLVVLRVGVVRDYDGDELDGNVTERGQLEQMVQYFEKAQRPTGQLPLIDFNHASVGPLAFMAHPDAAIPIGAVIEMRVIDDEIGAALEVVPGYTKRGRRLVDEAEGLLYPSATYRLRPTTDRMNAEPVAGAALLAFALTPTPATRIDQLGEIRNVNPAGVPPAHAGGAPMDGAEERADMPDVEVEMEDEAPAETPEEEIARLEARIAEIKAKMEANRAAEPAAGEDVARAFADRLVADKAINPADRAKWAANYRSNPAKAMADAPKAGAAYREPAGSAVKPKNAAAGLGANPPKATIEAHIRANATAQRTDYMTARSALLAARPELKNILEAR